MPKPAVGTIACPCCDLDAEVRETAKGKPYIVCDDCGFQGFARGQGAVAKLRTRMKPIVAAIAEALSDHQPDPEVDTMAAKKPAAKKPAAKKPAAKPAPKREALREEISQQHNRPAKSDDDDDFGKFCGFA